MLWAYHSYLACVIYFSLSSQEPSALLLKIQAYTGECWEWGNRSCYRSWQSKHCQYLSVSSTGFVNICKGLNFTGDSRAGFEVCSCLEGFGEFWKITAGYPLKVIAFCSLRFDLMCCWRRIGWDHRLPVHSFGKPLKRNFNYLLAEVMESAGFILYDSWYPCQSKGKKKKSEGFSD